MAYWLAKAREGQDTDTIQRFDPRFWTVDFPRPMIASVITTGPAALRVDCEFHNHDALAGLIWESEDRFDHPLLSYDTNRNYGNTTVTFLWRSSGVLPLDAVHGPTLTIEGRDAAGTARTWYVRLWNYAAGDPDDARITLRFSELREGWTAEGAPVPMGDIDRLFISLAPTDYDPANADLLPSRQDGWVELTEIACDGEFAMLTIGDAVLPPHGIGISTAYDDSYNQTPARMLRNALHLGYRGTLVHYVGMSHFFRLAADANGKLIADPDTLLCTPCVKWHEAFFAGCVALRMQPIISLSFELFNAHCPESWKQRDWNGNPALTGWEPPSTLLSPVVNDAVSYLEDVAQAFTEIQLASGLEAQFQVGEPWWWVNPDGLPCIYDSEARAAYGDPPEISDLSVNYVSRERDFLDWCALQLATAVQRMASRAKLTAQGEAKTHVLLFTPTLLDPKRPAIAAMNLDASLSWDAFDVLQVEDYDWLTDGAEALRRAAYTELDNRFGYPLAAQHYLGGFVLDPEDANTFWARIDAGIDEALARGVDRAFVWALPQITRDGYVRLPFEEKEMQAFDDVLYPLNLGRDTGVSPEFSTSISLTASGHERRNSQWSDARLNFDVGPGIRSEAELGVLLEFFRARRGPARGFRLSDPFDYSSNGLTGTPMMTDQIIGIGDGLAATFRLAKSYGGGVDPQRRFITRPRGQTILISIDGAATNDWTLVDGGKIIFTMAPAQNAEIRAGFLFDVPVRFAEDRLDISRTTFAAGEAPSVPLIELREEI
ncbi:DUF2460 domain-containing protein [Aurantiacibacter marinus]|uniref:TIGR02217 family protein n=1 Tax=Aurantiacibacter marinus TaxID=874156 RepID=A0A0H0XR99_9SPHN|nr:DUF2460 domain-containing protein [Aurantiacibacter marinus]KLI64854.1 hypothetical protein AAV99_04935 [Aurantiacibacter marinus]